MQISLDHMAYISTWYFIHRIFSGRRRDMLMEPTYLNGVECEGDEDQIVACRNKGWDKHQRGSCSMHTNDAGVECFDEGQWIVQSQQLEKFQKNSG